MNTNWNYYTYSRTGDDHRRLSMLCQDQVYCLTNNNCYTAVLIDGIGKTNYNSMAGTRITSHIAHFLNEKELEIRSSSNQLVAKNVMLQIQRSLDYLSCEYNVDQKELASTFLALQVDADHERYTLMHLGDGVAAARFSNKTVRLLSEPENGAVKNETILTTSENALAKLRIQKGNTHNIQSFLLATDGIYNTPQDRFFLEYLFQNCKMCDKIGYKADDKSVIMLFRTTDDSDNTSNTDFLYR